MLKYLNIPLLILAMACHANATSSKKTDQDYMQMAIKMAKQNPQYPFGAVIVDNTTGKVLCQGVNDAPKSHNPTHHGEMVTINNCAKNHPHLNWKNTTLYTTAEPCPMCQGAIIWAGIPLVVYGTSIDNLQHLGWSQIDINPETLNKRADFYHGNIKGEILGDQTDALFNRKG